MITLWKRHGQQHARHAADGESEHEANRPQHGHGELDAAAVHGEQPVEDLRARRDRDDHRGDAKERIDAGARAHGEEVVQPHQVGQDGDHDGGIHHRGVAKQALAAEGGDDLGEHAKAGQDQDVDLWVATDPDQVHVQHGVAAQLVGEEVGAHVAVQRQQHQHGRQHGEGSHDQRVGAQRRPGEHGHLHQAHAGRAHLDDGDDQRPDVVIKADAGVVFAQARQRQPAQRGELAQKERQHHQHGAAGGHPEAEVVEEGEGHVACANLQRHQIVHQAGHKRHGHEEDHDHAVGGEDLVVVVRGQVAHGIACGHGLLGAHHDGVREAAQEHDQAQDHVHDADVLVVNTADPVLPQWAPTDGT
ncbi:hypothetical protein FQA39_LY19357 [Lamprigera yunnana]|nr:hypothetical protein FQA39_LY19357 [Lamprigera yunnana]